jgi:hypothetical protein
MQNHLRIEHRDRRRWLLREKQFACEERRKPVLRWQHWPEAS